MSWLAKMTGRLRPEGTESTSERRDGPSKHKAERTEQRSAKGSKQKYIACFDGLVDVAEDSDRPVFLVCEDGQLRIQEATVVKGKTLRPPPIESTPFPLVNAEAVRAEFETRLHASQQSVNCQLFDDVKSYVCGLSELPSEEHYDLCAAWIIHTYRLEQMQYSPVLWLFAVPERGKTRTGKGMAMASFRGLHVECLSQAYLLRIAQDWH